MVTPHLPWKFHANRSSRFLVMLLTTKQTKKERKKSLDYNTPSPYRGRVTKPDSKQTNKQTNKQWKTYNRRHTQVSVRCLRQTDCDVFVWKKYIKFCPIHDTSYQNFCSAWFSVTGQIRILKNGDIQWHNFHTVGFKCFMKHDWSQNREMVSVTWLMDRLLNHKEGILFILLQ